MSVVLLMCRCLSKSCLSTCVYRCIFLVPERSWMCKALMVTSTRVVWISYLTFNLGLHRLVYATITSVLLSVNQQWMWWECLRFLGIKFSCPTDHYVISVLTVLFCACLLSLFLFKAQCLYDVICLISVTSITGTRMEREWSSGSEQKVLFVCCVCVPQQV